MTQSPELTGGAGFTFEGTLVATYLVSLLIEGSVRGLPGRTALRVAVQQAAFGEPLDDLIVDAHAVDGTRARISLQIKRSLTISAAASNTDFREIVVNAWKTLDRIGFRDGIDRVGVATGDVSSNAARALETVSQTARDSASADSFAAHFAPDAGAGEDLRQIIATFRTILTGYLDRPTSDADIYRLLRHFIILRFDLLHDGASDESEAEDRLRPFLKPEDAQKAGALWNRLKTIARESAGRAADFTRKTLLENLHGEFRLAGALSLRDDLEKLATSAHLALQDIGADIDGIEVERDALVQRTEQATARHRFVQLIGLPGSGKSAVLRAVAAKRQAIGPVLALKSDRLAAGGWPAYAISIGVTSTDPEEMLLELASMGTPTLIIDGLDRIEVPHRGVVADLIQALFKNPALDQWRIIASLRDNGTEPLRTWLPQALLAEGGVSTIEVAGFDDDEARRLADRVPRLRSLLFAQNDRVRDIARRPFFAGVLARSIQPTATSSPVAAPKSEIDLIEVWWSRGGYAAEGADTTRRQRSLKQLARSGASTMGRRMSIDDLDADALNDLKSDGIVSDVRSGHTVKFTHDIFFEWSFLHLLIAKDKDWLTEIREAGEPPVLGRVVELLSQSVYMADDGWEPHLAIIEAAGMRPQWARAWLIGPFAAASFNDRTTSFIDAVFRDQARRFTKLVVWFQAEKTRANPNVLAGTIPAGGKSSFQIAQLADFVAWPSDLALWKRFCDWLLDNIQRCPIGAVSDVTSAFEVWQNMLADVPNPVSERIITIAVSWLQDIEDRRHSETWDSARGSWDALGRNELSELERRLRMLVLRSARSMPELVRAYLKRLQGRVRLRRATFGQVAAFAPTLAAAHAVEVVDIAFAELLDELPRQSLERARNERAFGSHSFDHDWHQLAIERSHSEFHPPSPVREPFASLFKQSPSEALRLVQGLCNHAMEAWRQLYELDRQRHDVPIPLDLDFPWGRQKFWGTAQVYGWFRGFGGPQVIECALMALEDWAFSQVEDGRDIDEVIRDVVTGNDCCAVLGIAATLALAYNRVSPSTLPLATSQRLWHWDIQRSVQDASGIPVNMIGFNLTGEQGTHTAAVQAINTRPVRQHEIRNLAMLFVITANDALRTACRTTLEAFPVNLPFEFESQKEGEENAGWLRRTAEIWSEIGKSENYVAVRAQDGGGTLITLQNPRSADADVVASVQQVQEINARSALWLWADDCFKSGKLSDRLPLAEVLSRARALDKPDLFKNRASHGDLGDILLGGLAGTAAAALAFGGTLDDVDLAWAKGVIERAGETPEINNGLWFAGSHHPHHPCVYAPRGLAALIRRDTDTDDAKRRLLALVAHPLDQVSEEAIAAAFGLWQHDPNFAFIVLDLGLRLSVGARQAVRSAYGYDPRGDGERRAPFVADALRHLDAIDPLVTLPKMPPPWVFAPHPEFEGAPKGRSRRSATAVWRESDELFLWNYAPRVLRRIPIENVIADDLRRPPFLSMCTDLLAWTIERLAPSWETDDEDRRERRSADLLEWRRSLFTFLGRVSSCIEPDEARRLFLEPVFRLEDELCSSLLEPFVDTYICAAILDSSDIRPGAIDLLESCVERILRDNALTRSSDRDGNIYGHYLPDLIRALFFIRYQANGSTRFANGNWTDVRFILPVVESMMKAAGAIPHVIESFLTLCERAVEHYPSDRFVKSMLGVLGKSPATPPGWRGSFIPARIAALVHEFGARTQPLPHALAQDMLRLLDLLVDMGDRRAAALQTSEIFKDVRLARASAPLGT